MEAPLPDVLLFLAHMFASFTFTPQFILLGRRCWNKGDVPVRKPICFLFDFDIQDTVAENGFTSRTHRHRRRLDSDVTFRVLADRRETRTYIRQRRESPSVFTEARCVCGSAV